MYNSNFDKYMIRTGAAAVIILVGVSTLNLLSSGGGSHSYSNTSELDELVETAYMTADIYVKIHRGKYPDDLVELSVRFDKLLENLTRKKMSKALDLYEHQQGKQGV